MPYAKSGEDRLYYEESGEGTPLIFLHGFSLDRRMWDGQFELVAERYRAIRYDARAHGRSQADSVQFADWDDLRQLLDALEIPRAVIVGLSMGGRIAVDFALTDPDRVAGLVLVGAGLSGFEPRSEEIAGYKGYGFAMVVEMLSAALQDGSYLKGLLGYDEEGNRTFYKLGHFFIVINVVLHRPRPVQGHNRRHLP